MEEYLRNMKNLRSQMNDFEEEAAYLSVEEQKQITAIQTLEKDLDTVRSETRHFKKEMDEMVKTKGQICCQIIEKQKKLSSLEMESSTHSQTLELLEQEGISIQGKLKEKSTYYSKVKVDFSAKLQEQKEWFNSMKLNLSTDIQSELPDNQMDSIEERPSREILSIQKNDEHMMQKCSPSNGKRKRRYKDLMVLLEAAKANLERITGKKSEVGLKMVQSKQLIEQVKNLLESFPPEIAAMDIKTLEEERQALLADKAGEMEYLQSLQGRIEQLKCISEEVTCQCGKVYKVNLRE